MKLTRKQLEENYDATVKRSDLYYVALMTVAITSKCGVKAYGPSTIA